MLSPIEQSEVVVRSATILQSARNQQWERADEQLTKMYDDCGPESIAIMMVALADTMVLAQGGEPDPDHLVVPQWVSVETGETDLDADTVPPLARWVGRFIVARANRDYHMCTALVASLGPEEHARAVTALIEVVAATLNKIGAPSWPQQ